jgi:hypothetical protein
MMESKMLLIKLLQRYAMKSVKSKQVRRITEKYTQKFEHLQAWGRSQEMKIQELQDQNATQKVIIKEL